MTWRVIHDPRFGGWIITLPDGSLVARFESEQDARAAVLAVNTMTSLGRILVDARMPVPNRRATWEARA